ncbi:MAG: hypothetical protein ACLTKE_01885 [Coprococcus sp.]
MKSNEIEVTVKGSAEGAEHIVIQGEDNREVKVGEKLAFTLKERTDAAWSVTDFFTGEETEAAVISETGELTAREMVLCG